MVCMFFTEMFSFHKLINLFCSFSRDRHDLKWPLFFLFMLERSDYFYFDRFPSLLVAGFLYSVCNSNSPPPPPRCLQMCTQRLFLTVLLMSDVMSVHFFFLVTDAGSWQDIGFSISHHVIATGTSCFLLLLHGAARVLTSATWWSPLESVLSERRRSRVNKFGTEEFEVAVDDGRAAAGGEARVKTVMWGVRMW